MIRDGRLMSAYGGESGTPFVILSEVQWIRLGSRAVERIHSTALRMTEKGRHSS